MWKFNFAQWIAANLVPCVESFATEFWKITHMGTNNTVIFKKFFRNI